MFGFKTSMEESLDLSEYETYKLNEIDVGVKFTGQPVAIRFEPDEYEEKNYTSMRLQLQNHEDKQILNCYCILIHIAHIFSFLHSCLSIIIFVL